MEKYRKQLRCFFALPLLLLFFIAATPLPSSAPIPPATLAQYLPQLDGFTMSTPVNSEEDSHGGKSWSSTKATYIHDSLTVVVTISDYNNDSSMSYPDAGYITGKADLTSDHEVIRAERIGGFPGWYRWVETDRTYYYSGVALNDRIFVTAECSKGGSPYDAIAILLRMNLNALSQITSNA
jgi:hypothetical protein